MDEGRVTVMTYVLLYVLDLWTFLIRVGPERAPGPTEMEGRPGHRDPWHRGKDLFPGPSERNHE